MAKTLKEWIATDVADAEKLGISKMSNEYFFRDPPRPTYVDHEYFYSPADGTILYQKIVDPTEKIVEIKGINYTLQDVMGDSTYNKRSLVIGIFMSFFDVHINRVPYGGILKYKRLDPIESTNLPMLALEKDILNKTINPNNMGYMKNNERMINTIYSPSLDYTYHVIQIADEDVDVICHFTQEQNELYGQNDRFSLIRWGSQAEIIAPIDDRYEFELCLPDHMHVEAGLDRLFRIHYK